MYNLGMKKRNIAVMYLISLFQGMVFYASVSTLYRTARGLSLSQYALIDSITFVFTLALEVPWGVVADRIGYKKTLIIANGLYALSKLVFLKAWGFWGFLLERVFFAAAVSGLSGVDMSVLYLSCDKDEEGIRQIPGFRQCRHADISRTVLINENDASAGSAVYSAGLSGRIIIKLHAC